MGANVPLLLTIVVLLCVVLPATSGSGVYAFGAGNIPSFAYLEGKAFRHGDIEDILSDIAKSSGGMLAMLGGRKFGGLDIKRIYFGNWLRDYSQAVDIAGLKALPLQTILNLCMALGFLAHGYATNEFEVTTERLACYLPTEHIDNPKGYGEGEDPRKYHPGLRGPVDPRELEIDPNTGMKNYIANEHGTWDTSKALVRRRMEECINLGRKYRQSNAKADLYESFRLLGTALHTLEDFPAHSNFCELALIAQGHTHVFSHVGDQVRVRSPGGKMVPPLVTGTFGGDDFMHSLLGEASDHLSQASVSDLNHELDKAKTKSRDRGPGGGVDDMKLLQDLLFQIPGIDGKDQLSRDMNNMQRLRAAPGQPGQKKPEEMSPQELHATLWQILSFRDSVVKKIEKTIEKIPGLGPLIEKLMDSISVFIFTTLEPYLKPLLKTATGALSTQSANVINTHDQYEVFNLPHASDPTHSFLSKDHFNLILNEPAGNLAIIIVRHAVKLVVEAWDAKNLDMKRTTDQILECLFHPDFYNRNSKIQSEMMGYMNQWLEGYGHKKGEILQRLSKESVRNHNNIRLAGHAGSNTKPQHGIEGQATSTFATNAAGNVQTSLAGYLNQIPGVSQAQGFMNFPSAHGTGREGSMPGPGGYVPPAGPQPGHTHRPSEGGAPPSSSGEAASFYNAPSGPPPGSYGAPSSPPPSQYGAPSGPPPGQYGAPPGPPPGQYGAPSGPPPGGWNYGSPPPGGPPSFPSYGAPSGPPGGGYGFPQTNYDAPPPGPGGFPSIPGGYGNPGYGSPPPPGGPPPGFPGFPGTQNYAPPGGPPPPPGSGYPGQWGH